MIKNEATYGLVLYTLFYNIPHAAWQQQLERMLNLLQPDGKLIIVAREQDDSYAFKMALRPRLFGSGYRPVTIDDILQRLPPDAVHHGQHTARSELTIPIDTSPEDAQAIMAFYLGKPWHEIPPDIQHDAISFIQNKQETFTQRDGIALITR